MRISAHDAWIRALDFSPDTLYVASAGNDNTIRIFNTDTGEHIRTLSGHTDAILAIDYISEGPDNAILSASEDTDIGFWDADTSEMLGILEDHTGSVWSIELDSNGNYIVSAGNVVFLWDFSPDDIEKFTLDGPVGEVHAAAFSPDNRYVVAAGEDMAVYIWELATRRQVARLTGHTDEVWSLEISPDGKWIATGSTDQTIKIWDLNAAVRGTATSHRRPDPGAIAVIPFALGE